MPRVQQNSFKSGSLQPRMQPLRQWSLPKFYPFQSKTKRLKESNLSCGLARDLHLVHNLTPRPQRKRSTVPMTRRSPNSVPWLSSVSRCLGSTQRSDPVSSTYRGTATFSTARPITASDTRPAGVIYWRRSCGFTARADGSCLERLGQSGLGGLLDWRLEAGQLVPGSSAAPEEPAAGKRLDWELGPDKWYSTARWARIRKHQLLEHPLCKYCLERAIVTPATICDHVEPHHGDVQQILARPLPVALQAMS